MVGFTKDMHNLAVSVTMNQILNNNKQGTILIKSSFPWTVHNSLVVALQNLYSTKRPGMLWAFQHSFSLSMGGVKTPIFKHIKKTLGKKKAHVIYSSGIKKRKQI